MKNTHIKDGSRTLIYKPMKRANNFGISAKLIGYIRGGRKFLYSLALIAFFTLSTGAQNAQVTSNPAQADSQSPLLLIIAALVPLVIQIVKLVAGSLPTWSLPVIAPLLGMLLDYIGSLISGGHATPGVGALLGLAGVGVRELIDQVGGRVIAGKTVVLVLLASLSLGMTGCGTVQVRQGSDPIVVNAEYLAENSLNSVNEFLAWERSHEAVLLKKNPGVHDFAQSLRSESRDVKGPAELRVIELRTLTKQYQKDKTAANGDKLKLTTATVLNLVNTARGHMGLPPITLLSGQQQPSVRDLMKPVSQ